MIFGALVFCLMAPIASMAAVQPLSLSYVGNKIRATDSANTLDETSELYLVWDLMHRGYELSAWPEDNRIQFTGVIPSEDFVYDFDRTGIPAGSKFRIIATSKARLLNEGGYVYLGASQYVNTGVVANRVYGLEIKFQHTKDDYTVGCPWATLIGNNADDHFCIGRVRYSINASNLEHDKFYLRKQGVQYLSSSANFIHFNLNNDFGIHTIAITESTTALDGITVFSSLSSGALGKANYDHPILLGVAPNGGKTNIKNGNNGYCHAKWYSVRFLGASGNEILNLLPAVRNGEGLLYDTRSGVCFANANSESGVLTYGGEKGAVISGTEVVSAASDVITNEIVVNLVPEAVEVVVPAGMLDSRSALWLVWDTEDRGVKLANWPVTNRVRYNGDVSLLAGTYRFPKGNLSRKCVFRVIATSEVELLGEGSYIYAGKGQYFDTGIKANAIYGMSLKFMYLGNDYSGYNAYGLLISDEGNKDFAIGRYAANKQPDGKFYLKHRNTTTTPNGYFDISGDGLGQVHELSIADQAMTLDGEVVVTGLEQGTVGKKNLRVWLNNGFVDDSTTEGSLSGKQCHVRWYSVRFNDNDGEAILNLVPAVVASSTAVFYDTVSGNIIRNAGEGELTFEGTPVETVNNCTIAKSLPVLYKDNGLVIILR